MSKNAPLFPIFLKLEGRTCLVVGAGPVGEGKIRSLLESGAQVRVVSPSATSQVRDWLESNRISWAPREFESADLEGIFLVVAATSSTEVNDTIFAEAQLRHSALQCSRRSRSMRLLLPIGGSPWKSSDCDFDRGRQPLLAQRLRKELEQDSA